MTALGRHLLRRSALARLGALLAMLAAAMSAQALISIEPINTNAAAADHQRFLNFYQAEQSFQKQLKVGRERYNQKQVVRASVIAAQSFELQTRQQVVALQRPAPPTPQASRPLNGFFPLFVAVLAVGFVGFSHYLHRQRPTEDADQDESAPEPEPPVVYRSIAEEVFHCIGDGTDGRGLYKKEGFMVLKGSIGFKESVPSIQGKPAVALRMTLLNSGVTREEGEAVIFEQDQLFPTPSMAAVALLGKTANGWLEWRTEDGITLDAMERVQPRGEVAPEEPAVKALLEAVPSRVVASFTRLISRGKKA